MASVDVAPPPLRERLAICVIREDGFAHATRHRVIERTGNLKAKWRDVC
jgi:hypothetical protein